MSDSYLIDGVTITPKGGGVYELSHPKLADPVIERGKEKADSRAAEIAKTIGEDDARMEPQGTTLTPLPGAAPAPPSEPQDDRVTQLEAALRAETARANKLEEAVKTVSTVVAEPPKPEGVVPGAIPRKFTADMDAETVRLMKKMGVGVSKIVLEENESIPPTGLFIGHNGRGYMIQPGVEVYVPDFLLEVLDNAVTSSPVISPDTKRIVGHRNRMRYSYRRVKE